MITPNDLNQEQYLNTKQVCKMLHITRSKLGMLNKYGLLKGVRISRSWLYRYSDIDRFWMECSGERLTNEQYIRLYAQKKGLWKPNND